MTITSLNIAEGTVSRTRFPRITRKRLVLLAAAVLILIVVVLVVANHYGLLGNSPSKLVPPNPSRNLPPSASKLHSFKKAAVCADGAICAEIGKTLLERGGGAVDAAIGTMFCNGIFTMQSMGLGGGFLMTIYIKEENRSYVLNAREMAPLNATPELYKDDPLLSQNGPLSIAVPGELKGYWTAHQRFGKLDWKDVIEPSIELCEKGYEMSKHQADSLSKTKLHNDTNFREWFYDASGKFKPAGSKVIPRNLCRTLRTIAERGGDDLYNGTLSKLLLQDLKQIGSIITEEDLHNYKAEWMDPVTIELSNNRRLFSVPPPGSGALLAFILNILRGFQFTSKNIQGVENTVSTYHKIIEAFKYAYAKRTELGDTSFVDIRNLLSNLTSNDYAEEIRSQISPNSTSLNPEDYGAVFYAKTDHGTAHISVMAENGDAVSATSSINIYFGAGLTSEQTGIILNSVMDDFSFPYFKNFFGLPGSPNNQLKPGKRPLSSMTPTIVVGGDGNPELVIGASGGTKITTAVALVIMRTLWFGQNIKEAVDAPRIHHQLYPMQVQYEYGTLQQIVDGLDRIGHKTVRYGDAGSIICALLRMADRIFANADYRKGGDVYGLD